MQWLNYIKQGFYDMALAKLNPPFIERILKLFNIRPLWKRYNAGQLILKAIVVPVLRLHLQQLALQPCTKYGTNVNYDNILDKFPMSYLNMDHLKIS